MCTSRQLSIIHISAKNILFKIIEWFFQNPKADRTEVTHSTDDKASATTFDDNENTSNSTFHDTKLDVLPLQTNKPVVPDDAETVTYSDSDASLVPDDTPSYQNQEEDPDMQNLMLMQWADSP